MRSHPLRDRVRVVCALLALCAAACAVHAQREPLVEKALRERFGEWAEGYTASLPSYTAVETIEQTKWDKRGVSQVQQRARYQYKLENGGGELTESRQPLPDNAPAAQRRGANAASDPTIFAKLALLVTRLSTRYHDQMKYFFAPDTSEGGSDAVIIGYKQTGGIGLMEVEGHAVYPNGKAWINPDDGSVIRIEEDFEYKTTRYSLAVDFARDPRLRAAVPVQITVRLFEKGRLELQNRFSYESFEAAKPASQANETPKQ